MVLEKDVTKATDMYRTKNVNFHAPDVLHATFVKEWDCKYGENPHQGAAIYYLAFLGEHNTSIISQLTNVQYVRTDSKGKNGLSLTNMMDICRAIDVLKYHCEGQAAVLMKHDIISGFAKENPGQQISMQDQLFRLSRDTDLRSNYGATASFSRPLDMVTAEAMYELKETKDFFVDVVAAPDYEKGVIGFLERKSANLRIAKFSNLDKMPRFIGDETYNLLSIKELGQGRFGIQELPLTGIRTADDLVLRPYVVKDGVRYQIDREPTKVEMDDLLTAWWLNVTGLRSNGVCFVRDGISTAIGAGQVERVGAIEQAIIKGTQKAMDREGIRYDPLMGIRCSRKLKNPPFKKGRMSSDGFLPFEDNIETVARVGVTAVVHPYGSKRDYLSIIAANKHKIAMPATLERSFGHW